jgi:hypothetical protein
MFPFDWVEFCVWFSLSRLAHAETDLRVKLKMEKRSRGSKMHFRSSAGLRLGASISSVLASRGGRFPCEKV